MAIPFSAAASAYGNAARLISDSVKNLGAPALPAGEGNDFAKLLAQNIQSVADAAQNSDQKSLDLVNGRADIVDTVTAISQTEIAIESMVAIRDRVISAYEEIMRMPI